MKHKEYEIKWVTQVIQNLLWYDVFATFKVCNKFIVIVTPEGGGGEDEALVLTEANVRKIEDGISKGIDLSDYVQSKIVAGWGY